VLHRRTSRRSQSIRPWKSIRATESRGECWLVTGESHCSQNFTNALKFPVFVNLKFQI
jgi:hypothetical protein